jgi:glutamine amidotransferase
VSAPAIAIVDYGMGNRRSVEKALGHVGARADVTRDPDRVRRADGVVVPGVGAFPQAMSNLRELGLDEAIVDRVEAGAPVLGICLGMQLLFDSSVELGGAEGLGVVAGSVDDLDARGAKLPHIGWNPVSWARSSALTEGLPQPCAFYDVHTFVPRPAEEVDVLGTSDYGERFTTAIDLTERTGAPVFGVQFHPEKSSTHGLRLLENFARVCARVAA